MRGRTRRSPAPSEVSPGREGESGRGKVGWRLETVKTRTIRLQTGPVRSGQCPALSICHVVHVSFDAKVGRHGINLRVAGQVHFHVRTTGQSRVCQPTSPAHSVHVV